MAQRQSQNGQAREHRDFPRLNVEAKVRIAGSGEGSAASDQPAIISDLSLGGARLSTPAALPKGAGIGIIPFSGLQEGHPLHKVLEFDVMWAGEPAPETGGEASWREYGLAHRGSVLEVLNSWLGHLLLRQKGPTDSGQASRQRRFRFQNGPEWPVRARSSHDSQSFDLTLLDLAPGGLLARSETDDIPIGLHLEFDPVWGGSTLERHDLSLAGCVVDCHSQSGATFYRVAFDPDSELDEERLIDWVAGLGGESDS